jgi:hypothetical protein
MHRIDGANTLPALPAPLAPGAPGYFENAPGAGPGTVVSGDWLNAVQEEIIAVITAGGGVLDKANRAQLVAAIQTLVGFRNVLTLSAAGLTNWVVPAGITRVFAQLWGPGGGCDLGAGSPTFIGSDGGGGGGYSAKLCTVVPGATIPLTVGAKGVAGSPGTSGGTTSFGSVFSATGGGRGVYNGAVGGNPGNGVGGDINVAGGRGGRVQNLPSHVIGATGGGSPRGGAGGGLGVSGTWPGGGGGGSGGGDGQSHLAGDGAEGGIILTW